MNTTYLSKVLIALVVGTAAGVLARHGIILAFANVFADRAWGSIGVTCLGSVAVGVAIGWLSSSKSINADRRVMWIVGLVTLLCSFAASAVLDTAAMSAAHERSPFYAAIAHIAVGILAAAVALAAVQRSHSRPPP